MNARTLQTPSARWRAALSRFSGLRRIVAPPFQPIRQDWNAVARSGGDRVRKQGSLIVAALEQAAAM